MSTATLAYDFMLGMEAGIRAAIAAVDPGGNVLVDYGYPEPARADDMILIIKLDSAQDWATLGNTRSREETLMLEVHFCSWRSDQKQANAAAYGWLKLVERYCRMTDTTLGGVMRETKLVRISSQGYTYDGDISKGRGCEAIATFMGSQRVSG